jgi:hypothetical protein
MTDLDQAVLGVRDAKDLANFIGQMATDFHDDQDSWENITIYDYLESMSAWLEDTNRFYKSHSDSSLEQPSWQFFANLLLSAKIYE